MITTRRNHMDGETPHSAADQTIAAAQPRDEDVARRAYELYEQRGAGDGRDWDDWFEAERELRQSTAAVPRRQEEAE